MDRQIDEYSKRFFGARVQTMERLAKLYGATYFGDKDLEAKRQVMYQQEIERMGRYLDMEAGGNVLDVGCGPGHFLSRFGDQWDKYGIEVSPWAREQANENGVKTDFELVDNYFDLVVFRGTWQHIPDPISRLGEAYYWLKTGGRIVFLATPNLNATYYKVFQKGYSQVNFVRPTNLMLEQVLRNFGFTMLGFEYPYIETPYANPLKDTVNLALKLFHLKKGEVPTFGKMMECYAMK